MLFAFLAYFISLNVVFDFSNATLEGPASIFREEINDNDKESLPLSTENSYKWKKNPDRKYVWLDVAIDDVYVGRVTAEVTSSE
jgi:hypothetical protein